jgi:hypothetical protein
VAKRNQAEELQFLIKISGIIVGVHPEFGIKKLLRIFVPGGNKIRVGTKMIFKLIRK